MRHTVTLRSLFPRKLHFQLSAMFSLLFVGFIALYTVYAANKQYALIEQTMTDQASSFSAGLAASSEQALTTGEVWQLNTIMKQASRYPGLEEVNLTDPSGILLSSATSSTSELKPAKPIFKLQVPSTRLPHISPKPSDALPAHKILDIWIPVGAEFELGWMHARFSLAVAEDARKNFYLDSLASGILVSLLATISFVLFLRRPMQKLRSATNFAAQLHTVSGDILRADSDVADIDSLIDALNWASLRLFNQQLELSRSEAHFRSVVESLSELVFETDPNLLWTYLNPAWTDITQYSIEEGIGRSVLDFTPEDEKPLIAAAFKPLYKGEIDFLRNQFRYCTKHGGIRTLEVFARARRDEDGSFLGYNGTVNDVTARLQAERAIKEQLHFVERLIDSIPNAIYVKDTSGRYITLNTSFEHLFTIKRAEWIGKTAFDLISDITDTSWHQAQDAAMLSQPGSTQSFERRMVAQDGREIDVLFNKSLFLDADGKAAGIVGSITDISDRKTVELAMLQARDAAELANQSKSDFLANMSHEIRTPMNAVIGMTQLVLETELAPQQREFMSLVKQSADSLLNIIDDVLDFSKIEAGHLKFEQIPFSLKDCIEGALASLKPRAEHKQLTLDLELEAGIPEVLRGDPHRLRQVILNLVANALKFTEVGAVRINIALDHCDEKRADLCISVQDTGIGIPSEKLSLIFDSFSQADTSTTRRYGGTGLGLAISKRLVNGMGGQLWVDSEQGAGSTFFFTVSLERASANERAAAIALLHAPQTLPPLRLLLVEDNPVNQVLAHRLLSNMGHTVELVGDGQQCIDRLLHATPNTTDFDAVLMDLQMPIMGGIEACRLIRAHEKQHNLKRMPIIAMTAHALRGDRERCMEAGMDGYVTKPILVDSLRGELQRVLSPSGADAAPPEHQEQASIRFDRSWMLTQIGGDEALMHEVIQIFLNDFDAMQTRLIEAVGTLDANAVREAAHAIKGAVGNFGATDAVAAALALEQAGQHRNDAVFAELSTTLLGPLQKLKTDLEQELNTPK